MIVSENNVKIEGILASIDLEEGSYTTATGAKQDTIRGSITVRVNQEINGKAVVSDIPVHMFATKLTKKGTVNPAYDNIKTILTDYTSIAATNEEEADKIRITRGNIRMNEYYGRNGNLVSFPRIQASFVQRVKDNEEFTPEATFTCTAAVLKQDYEVDKTENETGRYLLQAAIVQFGEKLDVVPFIVENQEAINYISTNWESGNTVRINGKLNFSFKTEKTVTENAFGAPTVNSRTINISELIIVGGSEPIEGLEAYTEQDIKKGLADRKARLEELKERSSQPPKAPAKTSTNFNDVGF